jgi:ABC-type glycerol-3-phosphate transport system permease component
LSLVAFQRSGDDSIAAVLSLIFLAPAVIVLLLAGRQMLPGVAADHLIQKR